MKFKLARDFLVLSSGQAISKVVGFVAFAYLARSLGPASYGVAEYAVGLAVFFTMVVDWGMGPLGVRALAAKPESAASMAAIIPAARLIIACVAIPGLGLFALWSGQPKTTVILVWLYALSLLGVPWNQDWLLQGREMMTAAALAQLVRMCVFAVVVVTLVHGEGDILFVGVAELVAVGVTTAYYLGVQGSQICPVRLKFTIHELKRLVREGFSIGLGNVIWAFVQYAPLFLVANLVGGVALAWFAAAHRVVVSLLTFSWIYYWNLYPAMARRVGGGPHELRELINASFRVVAWGGILVALILSMAGRPLMALAFGSAFAEAAPAFAVLVWCLPVTLLSGHARWALIAQGFQRYVLYAQLAGAVVVLTSGIALTGSFGAVGAATAMTAASMAIWVVAHALAMRTVGQLPGIKATFLPASGAVLSGLLGQALDGNPVLGAAVAAMAYVLFALLVDRRLMPDLLRLMRAKSDVEARTREV